MIPAGKWRGRGSRCLLCFSRSGFFLANAAVPQMKTPGPNCLAGRPDGRQLAAGQRLAATVFPHSQQAMHMMLPISSTAALRRRNPGCSAGAGQLSRRSLRCGPACCKGCGLGSAYDATWQRSRRCWPSRRRGVPAQSSSARNGRMRPRTWR